MLHSRIFRVFVSSTFADLIEERNALHAHVFPELTQICERAGCRFQAIDLRWGVSKESALDHRTAKICLTEVERCKAITPRPNFIILLGSRYGWRPLPEEIESDEFASLREKAEELRLENKSLLAEWYRLDANAVPPTYVLRPRERRGEIDHTDSNEWSKRVEEPLRSLLASCAEAILLPEQRRIQYERSLTEREILAGALTLSDEDARDRVFAYFREADELADVHGTEADREARLRLRNLKASIERKLGVERVRKFPAGGSDSGIGTTHLPALCDAVLGDLRRVIESEIAKLTAVDQLEAEVESHRIFGGMRGGKGHFYGQSDLLRRIHEYVSAREANRALIIRGPSGIGKSTLLARAAEVAHDENPDAIVITRFAGATPSSVNAHLLLESIFRECGRRLKSESDPPSDFVELAKAFRDQLGCASEEAPIILFLDGLDQVVMSKRISKLDWLPRQLPSHVRLVVSVVTDPVIGDHHGDQREERSRWPFLQHSRPEDIVDVVSYPRDAAEKLLKYWLEADCRTLTVSQRQLVLDAFARCPRPLFLRLLAEECKLWRSYDENPRVPSAQCPEDILSAIINQMIDRLSQRSAHGGLLVERAIGNLIAARNGLTEPELIELLSADREFFEDFLRSAESVGQPLPKELDSLPLSVWVRLYADLAPYLTSRLGDETTLYTFYHSSIERAARERFFATPDIAAERHRHIASYFEKQPWFREGDDSRQAGPGKLSPTPRTVNIRKVAEMPFQLLEVAKLLGSGDAKSEHWGAIANLLLDIEFLEAKTEGAISTA